MKFCTHHHDQLTGEGDCFVCEIASLRQVINEAQAEIRALKKVLAENNIPAPK